MDAIDRKILALLQQDASHSVAEIGSLNHVAARY